MRNSSSTANGYFVDKSRTPPVVCSLINLLKKPLKNGSDVMT